MTGDVRKIAYDGVVYELRWPLPLAAVASQHDMVRRWAEPWMQLSCRAAGNSLGAVDVSLWLGGGQSIALISDPPGAPASPPCGAGAPGAADDRTALALGRAALAALSRAHTTSDGLWKDIAQSVMEAAHAAGWHR